MAAVSDSPSAYPTAGVGLGFWLTSKLGHAWFSAWVEHGCMVMLVHGVGNVLGVHNRLTSLDLSGT